MRDTQGKETSLHYIRTKDGAEVDFAINEGRDLTDLIECKLSESAVSKALLRFAAEFPNAKAVQVVRDLRNEQQVRNVKIVRAAQWLLRLLA